MSRTLLIFALALITTSPKAFASNVKSIVNDRNCSGRISDVNCYSKAINEIAHEQNVQAGFVVADDRDVRKASINRAIYQGQKIVVDTEDRTSCEAVKNYVLSSRFNESKNSLGLNGLCDNKSRNPEDRYRSITLMWETSEEYLTPLKFNFLKSSEKNLITDTRNIAYLMLATVGLLWVMPESVSKWDKDEVKSTGFFNKWKENAGSRPVKDKDDPLVNYVGHPISGAAYYMVARTQGYSAMQSFGYSVLMSTFFWEYGFESLAEKPSIQDLILTPVLGSILGEMFFKWSENIQENGGRVLGSKKVGSVVLFVLNPAGELSSKINQWMGKPVIRDSTTSLVLARKAGPTPNQAAANYIGIRFLFKF